MENMKMKHTETSNKEAMIIEKPLFSSTLLALFTVLRKNYHERNIVATPGTMNMKALAKNRPDLKLN